MRGDELLEAAKTGDAETVRALLREDSSLARWKAASVETPLMEALYLGHRSLSEELADAAAAAEPLDIHAASPLGRFDPAGSSPDGAAVNSYAYDGWTPLHLAAFFGQRETSERLLAAGAQIAAVSRNTLTNTPLHAAVAGGHTDVALLLIDHGAAVDAKDSGGHTPMHIAAEAGNIRIVEALLARGADPLAVDTEDKTPLSRAAARNHVEIVDLINQDR